MLDIVLADEESLNNWIFTNKKAEVIFAMENGVEVAYENNGKVDAGEYAITAKFTGNENYELISDMQAVLTIKNDSYTFNTDTENDSASDIIISANDGIDPNKELVVKLVESNKTEEEYKE